MHFPMTLRSASRLASRRRSASGFSLAEMMVSLTIFSLLMGMIVEFSVESSKNMYLSEQKCTINKDMRNLTSQMSDDARDANFFVMYSNYTMAARTTASQELLQANSGDFLVLVTYGTPPSTLKFNIRPVASIVGYYRAPYQTNQTVIDPITGQAAVGLEPVRKFTLTVGNGLAANQYLLATGSADLPAGGTATTLEALLPDASQATIDSHTIVVQLAQGLADGCLFHNFWGKSVMLNGKIVQGNNDTSVHDTYNFTISPRG